MRPNLLCAARLVLALALAAALGGWSRPAPLDGLADARRAQALVGPGPWSQVVRIENRGRRTPYPATVYALVFELEGILWFYTDTDGTQSLSLRAGRACADEADLGPLFRGIDPGFAAWSVVADPAGPAAGTKPVPNGCFLESVAALRRQVAAGSLVGSPQLLSFYVPTVSGLRGHTVLTFRLGGRLAVVDSERADQPRFLPAGLPEEPRAIAGYLLGRPVTAARVLALGSFATGLSHARYAGLPLPPAPAG